jgi:hypothetical protein
MSMAFSRAEGELSSPLEVPQFVSCGADLQPSEYLHSYCSLDRHVRSERGNRLQEELSVWLNVIGWTATAVFASSYFFKEATTLRRIQALAACLWVLYGVKIHSAPVVASNLLVGVAAAYTSVRLVLSRRAKANP